MKRFLQSVILIIDCFLISCSNPTDVENPSDVAESSSGYNWEISTPNELGLNSTILNSAFDEASAKGFINSIIVIRNGKIAAEKYFNGRNFNSYQTIRSVSKSFLSALVGIAIDQGILNLDQKMIDSFPEYASSVTDSRVNNITLRHLLTMRSGLHGDEEVYFTITSSSNWIRTIVAMSLDFDPGSKAQYSTAGTHLISGMLTKASGMNVMDFANKYLFKPIGIVISNWIRDPQGFYFGGNDMFFTARNMAVLGLLYLNSGFFNGQQIVPAEWVSKSLVYSGGSSTVWGSLSNGGYGQLWWLGKVAGKNVFFALGHGGQYILCVPDLNIIVAATSDPYLDWDISDEHERAVLQIIADYIIPSASN